MKFVHILVGSMLVSCLRKESWQTNELPGDLEGRPLEERIRKTRWGCLTRELPEQEQTVG